jgi:hypothetical protein
VGTSARVERVKRHLQVLLQRIDLACDRGGHHATPPRHRREAAGLGHVDEDGQGFGEADRFHLCRTRKGFWQTQRILQMPRKE